jgi:hypothetical protein
MVDHICLLDDFDWICSMEYGGGFGENIQEDETNSKQLGKAETMDGCTTHTVGNYLQLKQMRSGGISSQT